MAVVVVVVVAFLEYIPVDKFSIDQAGLNYGDFVFRSVQVMLVFMKCRVITSHLSKEMELLLWPVL